MGTGMEFQSRSLLHQCNFYWIESVVLRLHPCLLKSTEGISTSLAMSLGLTVTSKWSPRAEPLVVCVATAMFAVWILKHVHDRPYIAGAAWFYAVVMAPVWALSLMFS